MTKILRAIAAIAIACMPLASCSVDSPTNPLVPIEQTTFASTLGVNLGASTKTANGAYYRDVTVGTGATVATGQLLSARYTGYFVNGTVFDSNTSSSSPIQFHLGSGEVIRGWDEGLAGIKVGGTRQLIIPPSLAYGSQDYYSIPGNSVLVFTVQVVAAQ